MKWSTCLFTSVKRNSALIEAGAELAAPHLVSLPFTSHCWVPWGISTKAEASDKQSRKITELPHRVLSDSRVLCEGHRYFQPVWRRAYEPILRVTCIVTMEPPKSWRERETSHPDALLTYCQTLDRHGHRNYQTTANDSQFQGMFSLWGLPIETMFWIGTRFSYHHPEESCQMNISF